MFDSVLACVFCMLCRFRNVRSASIESSEGRSAQASRGGSVRGIPGGGRADCKSSGERSGTNSQPRQATFLLMSFDLLFSICMFYLFLKNACFENCSIFMEGLATPSWPTIIVLLYGESPLITYYPSCDV